MPTLKQCKKIFWKPLVNLLHGQPFVEQINRSDYTISLKGGLPDIVCVGLNDGDGDRVRGFRIGALLADEWQDVKPNIWEEVLQPAMADTPDSLALFTGTPKGKMNHLYKFDQRSRELEDWQAFNFVTADNPFVPKKEIELAEATLDPRIFRQEYRASYEDFPGQIWDHLSDSHLVDEIPTTFDRCILGVDWGDVNPALATVGVISGWSDIGKIDQYYALDTWHSETGLNVLDDTLIDKATEFITRWGVTAIYCGHDRPASIEKWANHFAGRVYTCEQAFNSVSEGNNAVNGLLYHRKLLIASHLQRFKEKMASYHRAQDKYGNFLDEPAPGQDDHECLIAGTLVTTSIGEMPIERVKVGDFVLTRNGFKKVLWSGKTASKRSVVTVNFDNGKSLTGTLDHPIFTQSGWMSLDALRYNDVCIAIASSNLLCHPKEILKSRKKLFLMGLSFGDTQAHLKEAIAFITVLPQTISSKVSDICTVKSGNTIMEKFQKDTSFTTRMKTHLITTFQTLNVSRLKSIQSCTMKLIGGFNQVQANSTLKEFVKKLRSGISQKRAGHGIVSMAEKLLNRFNRENSSVNIAEQDTKLNHLALLDSARTNANQHGGERQGLITNLGNVNIASQSSLSTDTQNKNFVAVHAVNKIKENKLHDVYNLMVEDCPEFFANGILVHNCDALRYAIATDIYENSGAGWLSAL